MIYIYIYLFIYSPQLCVGFLFLILYPEPPPPSPPPLLRRHFVTQQLSHIISHTHLCQPPSLTHIFVHYHLSNTSLFTHIFVHYHLSHTSLSTTIFHTTISHTHLYQPSLSASSLTHIFVNHHISHHHLCQLAGVALGDIHLRFPWQAWHLETATLVSRGRLALVAGTTLSRTTSFTDNFVTTTLFYLSVLHHILCLSFFPRPRYNIWCSLLEEAALWGYPVL